MVEGEELPRQRERNNRQRNNRRKQRYNRRPATFSKNVVVVLGIKGDDQVDVVRGKASEFGEIVDVSCRVTRNDNFLYIVEFAEAAAATAAVKDMKISDDTSVAFKRLPSARPAPPRGEGNPQIVYVSGISDIEDTALLEIFGGEVTEITRGTENRYAFLHFATQEQAEAALSKNDIQIGDVALRVEPHRPILPRTPLVGPESDVKLVIIGPPDVNDQDLRQFLNEIGKVTRFSRRSRRVAFVIYETPEEATAALGRSNEVLPSTSGPITIRRFVNVKRQNTPVVRAAPAQSPAAKKTPARKPNPKRQNSVRTKELAPNAVYVANVNGLSDDAVKGFFTGNIVEYDRLSGGEAIIGFDTAQDANSALDQNDAALDDKTNLVVSKKRPITNRKRRYRNFRVLVTGFETGFPKDQLKEAFPTAQKLQMRNKYAVLFFKDQEAVNEVVAHSGQEIFEGIPLVLERLPRNKS